MMERIELLSQGERITLDVVMGVLAIFFVSGRFYIRYHHYSLNKHQRRPPTFLYILGDVFVGCALILCLIYAGADILLQTRPHIIVPTNQKELDQWIALRVHAAKTTAIDYIIGTIGQFMVKGAFLCYYLDARDGLTKGLRRLLWLDTAFVVAIFITLLGYVVGKCVPYKNYWIMERGNCLINHPKRDNLMFSLTHIAADVSIMAMGFLVIRSLRVHLQRRIIPAIAFIFFLGFLTICMNCVRMGVSFPLIRSLQNPDNVLGNGEAEKLSEWTLVISLADFTISLIAVSLPSMRIFIRKWVGDDGKHIDEPRSSPNTLPAFMTDTIMREEERNRGSMTAYGGSAATLGMMEMEHIRTSSTGSRPSNVSGLSEVRSQERKFSWTQFEEHELGSFGDFTSGAPRIALSSTERRSISIGIVKPGEEVLRS